MAALSPRPRSARKHSPLVTAGNLRFAAQRPVLGDRRDHPVSGSPGARSALSHHRDGRHVRRRHGDQCVASAVTARFPPGDRPANGFAVFHARLDQRQRARSDDRCVRGGAVAGRKALQPNLRRGAAAALRTKRGQSSLGRSQSPFASRNGRTSGDRGGFAPGAKARSDGPPDRRYRPRFQQPADRGRKQRDAAMRPCCGRADAEASGGHSEHCRPRRASDPAAARLFATPDAAARSRRTARTDLRDRRTARPLAARGHRGDDRSARRSVAGDGRSWGSLAQYRGQRPRRHAERRHFPARAIRAAAARWPRAASSASLSRSL